MEIESSNPQSTSLINKNVECDALAAMEAEKLRFLEPNKYSIESSHMRYIPCVEDMILGIVVDSKPDYIPCVEDMILGIVVDSKPDNFLVDIKGPSLAFLPVLAFEGGTRRNIPKFEVGTLLYVRVVKANSRLIPELACTDGTLPASPCSLLISTFVLST